jgi:hypothetical protein
MERTNRLVNDPDRDRNLISLALAARIGPDIDLAVDAEDLATFTRSAGFEITSSATSRGIGTCA